MFLWAEHQSQIDLLILSLLPLRCFWRLHLPHHCSSDASLHRLQQKEGGGCLEAPSGMMWLCLAEFRVSLTANPHVSNQHPAAPSTELLDASVISKSCLLFIIRIIVFIRAAINIYFDKRFMWWFTQLNISKYFIYISFSVYTCSAFLM